MQTLESQAWLCAPPVRTVLEVVRAAGGEARFVGGCVRDALLGRPFSDYDLAVTLPPETVMEACRRAGCKVVPKGLTHGTVLVVCDGQVFELTTLRRDVRTDGRHADVVFTDDWEEDAQRRDFTMNALFCDGKGVVTDYVGGVEDALAGRVRFVGDPEKRIREDVLRILRFFRFQAHYGRGDPDSAALSACRKLAPLLPGLSAERVQVEVLKLLAAPDPASGVRLMEKSGVLVALGLPFTQVDRLAAVASYPGTTPLHRLWAVVPDTTDMGVLGRHLRLSKADTALLQALQRLVPQLPDTAVAQKRLAYWHGPETVQAALSVTGRPVPTDPVFWQHPAFPLTGRDLVALGLPQGPQLGTLRAAVERWWVDGDFAPDRAACVAEARRIMASPPDRADPSAGS